LIETFLRKTVGFIAEAVVPSLRIVVCSVTELFSKRERPVNQQIFVARILAAAAVAIIRLPLKWMETFGVVLLAIGAMHRNCVVPNAPVRRCAIAASEPEPRVPSALSDRKRIRT
jgi:hypothetical protein